MSTEPSGLYQALLAVKKKVGTLPKDRSNPAYPRAKYTPLDTIVELVEPVLTENGLVWLTKPIRDELGDPALSYKLIHAETKEFEEGVMALLLTKSDPQGQGSAITYARRYALCSVLNLVADDDDDGQAASGGQAQTSKPTQAKGPSEKQAKLVKDLLTRKSVTVPQLEQMLTEIGAAKEIEPGWVEKLSGGKDGQVSALIDRLMNDQIPPAPEVVTPRSDVPEPHDGEFVHPAQPSLEDEVPGWTAETAEQAG